jgi:hypothetical protein
MRLLEFLRGRRSDTLVGAPEDLVARPEDWSVVTLRNEESGRAAVLRVRFEKPARRDLALLRTAIVVQWPYPDTNPMPPAEINEQQRQFERALDPLMPSELSELVHVSTGVGLKEWIFYARDSATFMLRFNELLEGQPAYPLNIEFYDDPEWRVWADLVRPLQARLNP